MELVLELFTPVTERGRGEGRSRERAEPQIAVSGPGLARSLTDLGLIDEYRLYFVPQ